MLLILAVEGAERKRFNKPHSYPFWEVARFSWLKRKADPEDWKRLGLHAAFSFRKHS